MPARSAAHRLLRRALIATIATSALALVAPAVSNAATCTVSTAGTNPLSTDCPTYAAGDDIVVNSGATLQLTSAPANPASLVVNAGGTVDMNGFDMTVDGNVELRGDSTGAATLESTAGSGTVTIAGFADLIFWRADLNNVVVTGSSATAKFIAPDASSTATTTTLTNATVDTSASTSIAFASCRTTDRTCYDYTISRASGADPSVLKLPAELQVDRDGAQLIFDLPVQVAPTGTKWSFSSQALPGSTGAANALLVVNDTLTTTSAGTPAITVVNEWSIAAPVLGTTITDIAASDVSVFTGSDEFGQNIAYSSDTLGSPQLLNAIKGPLLTNTTAPSISGTPQVGQTLTANDGTWSTTPTSTAYTWYTNGGSGSTFTPIGGATSQTYVPVSGDVGAQIKVRVTASAAGSADGSADSAAVTITQPTFTNTALPTVNGTAVPGAAGTFFNDHALSFTLGGWTPTPTDGSAQWYSAPALGSTFTAIPGATGLTLDPSSLGDGTKVKVQITVTLAGYADGVATSPEVVVRSPQIAPTSTLSIEGDATAGKTLSASAVTWSVDSPTVSYQWKLNGNVVSTAASYSVPANAPGDYTLVATAHKDGGWVDGTASATVTVKPEPITYALQDKSLPWVMTSYIDITSNGRFTVVRCLSFTAKFVDCPSSAGASTSQRLRVTPSANITSALLFVTVKAADGTESLQAFTAKVHKPTLDDVLGGSGSTTTLDMTGATWSPRYSAMELAAPWRVKCTGIPGNSGIDSSDSFSVKAQLTYTELPGGDMLQCFEQRQGVAYTTSYPTLHDDEFGFQPLLLTAYRRTVSGSSTAPVAYSKSLRVPITDGVNTLYITVNLRRLLSTGAPTGATSATFANATSPNAELSCPIPSGFGASNLTFTWSVNGQLQWGWINRSSIRVPDTAAFRNAKIECSAQWTPEGSNTMRQYTATLTISNGVRISSSVHSTTDRSRTGGSAKARSTARKMYFVKLSASGRRLVRVSAYRRIVTRVHGKSRVRFSIRATRTIVLRRGTRTYGVRVPESRRGYRIVVTPIRWRSARDHTVVSDSSMVFDVN
ncbi:MAG: hypothetical protein KDC46_09845 [Thermoleophilia bacterium]|nr:hypothetical protein [Thermoleophilia bacterium]